MENRLSKHNKRHSAATKSGAPWQLKKVVEFDTKKEAIKAKNWLKRMKSRKVIEQVIRDDINLKDIIAGYPPAGGSDRSVKN